ncbi:MAG: SDR family oxidoreductase [Clostridia bacterium]|nr:SDR family oxidoreductase [Clostridia bacterium]
MTILITGAAGGIGRSAAELFLEKGHLVAGIDVRPAALFDKSYTHFCADITKDPLPDIPGVEILVNCAGIQSQTEKDIDVNLKGTIRVCEAYASQPSIKAVVNIASASGSTGSEFPEYAASKGGVIAYTRYLAIKLAPYGATCNSISPGGVLTDMNKHILDNPQLSRAVLDETLLKKWATSREIAEWIYFVSAVNRSMTAQDILIDNGEASNFHFIW